MYSTGMSLDDMTQKNIQWGNSLAVGYGTVSAGIDWQQQKLTSEDLFNSNDYKRDNTGYYLTAQQKLDTVTLEGSVRGDDNEQFGWNGTWQTAAGWEFVPDSGATTAPGEFHCHPANAVNALERAKGMLTDVESYDKLSVEQRGQLRRIMLCISDVTDKVGKLPEVNADDKRLLKKLKSDMLNTIEYAPIWIIMAVALALGVGTMIGWRRVATTIGEKIGKKGMTYAQGMSAQMTAAVSIGLASYTGMPVSTTHVLSSSVAGTMIVDGGGLQRKTVTNILMAWVFTLPASILLSGGLYWISLQFL
jgi:phosphate/sulfate permease